MGSGLSLSSRGNDPLGTKWGRGRRGKGMGRRLRMS